MKELILNPLLISGRRKKEMKQIEEGLDVISNSIDTMLRFQEEGLKKKEN